MRILVGHNYYQQSGGEDAVVRLEVDLLRQRGHEVLLVEGFNKDFNRLSAFSKIGNILSWGWSQESYERIRKHCLEFRPDIAHFHNTFFMMTPSVYAACQSAGVPIVQTLHNFRLLCSNALLYRDGHVCEECLSASLNRGIKYGCYRNSRILTWAVVKMLKEHRRRKTWNTQIDAFIALTNSARLKFEQGGLPKDKIWVKPNSIAVDPGIRCEVGDYFAFAGRLSEEKGIMVLLNAFKDLKDIPLVIMGDGPLKRTVEDYIQKHDMKHVRLTGFLQSQEYYNTLKKSKAIIVPSVCYETFGIAIIEAFACGVAVIASNHGAMQELVQEGTTGVLFTPGDAEDLRIKIKTLLQDDRQISVLGAQARKIYDEKFSAEANYQQLIAIYQQAKMNSLF